MTHANHTPSPSLVSRVPDGPWLVTVREDCSGCGGTGVERHVGEVERCCVCKGRCVSRRASETLYGFPVSASAHVWEIIHAAHAKSTFKVHEWKAAQTALHRLPAEGGTVGPLPDGSSIVVEKTTTTALYRATPEDRRAEFLSRRYNSSREAAVAAFNASRDGGGAR